MWLNKHYWSGSQTNQMNHSKRFFFWFVFLSAFDCPLFFLAKTFTQAHYWQPSIRLPLLDKWWNVVWFQAIPPSRICQCELHQKAPHKKKNREVCSLVLRIFARTNLSCGEILACLFHLRWVLGNTLWGGKMLLLPLRDIKWQWLPATCWASHSLGASLPAHPPQFCAKSSRFSGGWDLLLFASRVPYVRDDVLTFGSSVQSQDCDLVRLEKDCYTVSWLKDLTLSRLINPADIHLGYQSIVKLGSMYLWVYEQNQSGANMQFSMLVREWAPHRHFTSITVWLHVKVWWGSIPVNFPEYQLNLWGNLSPSVHRNRVNEKPLCIKYHVQRCRFLCELLHKVANMPSSFVGYTV